ncbi:universal stress protein UspA [Reticulibacter mediterranei]|uniref:Universal stress protein UspA n=2 Tax=Reticulibacter mediterranei TaxID=2778369 RepID=A0A8J3N4Z4_9CHLR|nr:universal stress protein UspA [Reticulibacter mediterranei]
MFEHILVPLDGSERAEQAIPVATRIARATKGSVTLLHAASLEFFYVPSHTLSSSYALLEAELAQARQYLESTVRLEAFTDIKVHRVSLSGIAHQMILSYAKTQGVDLIVLCRHGSTGLKRWALGSVAQKVIRESPAPILVLPEESQQAKPLCPDETSDIRLLVALDGSSLAETVLVSAVHLAAALASPQRGQVHLLRVVPLLTREEEVIYQRYHISLEMRLALLSDAASYLQVVSEKVTRELADGLGIGISWSIKEGRDVAEMLLNMAEVSERITRERPYDAMALTTHGRSGWQRWLMGSITERVLAHAHLPLLIIRPQAVQEQKS